MISQTKERDRLEVNSTQAEISKFTCTYNYWGEAGWEGGAQQGIHIEPCKEPRGKSNEKAQHGS